METTTAPAGWRAARIPGVQRRTLTALADERGSFMELWRATWTADLGVELRQANLSRSQAGVLRGMHFHERQADLWVVAEGLAWVALVDLRPLLADPAAAPLVDRFEMPVGSAVFIPQGVAHGFVARERLALLYLVSREYDGTDEHGFAWDDPRAAIGWPVQNPVLSRRDATNPSIEEAVAGSRQRSVLGPSR